MSFFSGIGKIVGGILSIPKDAVQGAVDLVTGKPGKSLQDFAGIVKDPVSGIAAGVQDLEQDPLFKAITTVSFGPLPNVVLSAGSVLGLSSSGSGDSGNSGATMDSSKINSAFHADITRIFQKVFNFSNQIEKFFRSFLGEA